MAIAQEKQIFLSALDLPSPAERQAYLARVCDGDVALRQSVEALLAAHSQEGNVLDQPPQASEDLRRRLVDDNTAAFPLAAADTAVAEVDRAGEWVGNYQLLEQIGEGGFGQVYVAQQVQPMRRRVALKLLKLGMNSREILAQFDAERQALAMMDHPHIAKVFDAGTTANGQPFFAMELVRGVPITEFCEQHPLDIRERLELFIDVCQAVQHAHQKGIIHRDLKPSNVLVTLHDAKPIAKVIDFGVAKAIGEPLTDQTIYTRFMQMIGTPMYMSPEQAEMTSLDVDTRSDVFSLGMLLYELLTGSTPYDRNRLGTVAFDELRRIIREEELPRPSQRRSTLGKSASTTSDRRGERPAPLMLADLSGDLDWIVMKAIEKDRSRRYDSASALAQDLRRYLRSEPIEARPPSRWYRFSKFARRHKATLTAASLVAAALLVGTAISLWQAAAAVVERDAKEVARKEAEVARLEVEQFAAHLKQANRLLASGRAHADAGQWSAAAADYSHATAITPNYYYVWSERGAFLVRLGLWQAAAEDYAHALKLEAPLSGAEWWGGPQLLLLAGNQSGYQMACQRMWEESHGPDGPPVWTVRSCLFGSPTPVDTQTLVDAAESLFRRVNSLPVEGPPKSFTGVNIRRASASLPLGAGLYLTGLAHYRNGEFDLAIERLSASLTKDPKWPGKLIGYPALAMAYHRAGREAEARTGLDTASQVIDQWTSSMLEGPIGATPAPWFDYIECLLLHREATVLLTGTLPAPDPRFTRLEERARAATH